SLSPMAMGPGDASVSRSSRTAVLAPPGWEAALQGFNWWRALGIVLAVCIVVLAFRILPKSGSGRAPSRDVKALATQSSTAFGAPNLEASNMRIVHGDDTEPKATPPFDPKPPSSAGSPPTPTPSGAPLASTSTPRAAAPAGSAREAEPAAQSGQ